MTAATPLPVPADPASEAPVTRAEKRKKRSSANRAATSLSSRTGSLVAIIMAVLWTTPTFGLLVTSFRTQADIQDTGWWNAFGQLDRWTLSNYDMAFNGGGDNATPMGDFFINSIVIAVPAVFLPLLLASLAAYAFAWIKFPGRDWLFVAVFALQIVPLQIALLPLATWFTRVGIGGTFWALWLSHTAFALPLAVYLLHNFMKEIPPSLLEAARVDGASHMRIFLQVLLPLITPALASFGIFQFLWVWNDLLVALTMLGGSPENAPITMELNQISGTLGNRWYLLSAAAFISISVPVVVFVFMQRYFVRGLLAGGTKG
ncbi:carbohydrate ABC transporter permease [Kribbia dieselivorans]|uniref:carbohydrate ABC transporter permease n=1 Tax=Kribbia dieselivorans TaxID=331526 RepID=UPI0008391530|nr:carbohydrate ABC transporter permease [Kribbia dieselivorans]